ncbi:ATP-binding protein, partial [Candidatus Aminicenantes bacterium AC-335-O07]|nr:ATP-binding protein [Candidatus Aminicenantes bacterium AC-335-O07]
VFLLFLILLFVLGRNLTKLYLERKRKVIGSHFKTKLVFFFIGLSLIPTLLLFFFASDLINRSIEHWFRSPVDQILKDTQQVAEGFYSDKEAITYHYAKQLGIEIREKDFLLPGNTQALLDFLKEKIREYRLDLISVYIGEKELVTFLNPNLPLQDYQDLKENIIKRALLGENFKRIEPMGKGELIRRGISFNHPQVGRVLIVTGKFLPQNYYQSINRISSYIQKYKSLKILKDPIKTSYLLIFLFVTLLIIFAASWIGFHLAKSITNPIEKLAQATREVSKGNLDVRVEDPASDEIGILIESFNQMVSDLKESNKKIEQKTEEIERRKKYFETVLDNISTGVITVDANGFITTINPAAINLLQLNSQNPIGENYKIFLSNPTYSEIVNILDKAIEGKYKITEKEIHLKFENKTVTLALTITPFQDMNNNFMGLIVALDNVTQIITAQKIAAWKEVAQRVAHEIKNPLTPIQLSAERIIKSLGKEENKKIIEEGAKTIIQETRTIKNLVDEFSNFARLPVISLSYTDLHQIIEQTVSLFRGIYKEIEFEVLYSSEVPSKVYVDPEQIKRVFVNIISNAVEAMDKKGKVTIVTSYNPEIKTIRIEISDTGPGIPDSDKAKLFIPYFSTKKKGRGLGLSIVHQIITEHNGTIKVEDNIPHGAKFIIQIPS